MSKRIDTEFLKEFAKEEGLTDSDGYLIEISPEKTTTEQQEQKNIFSDIFGEIKPFGQTAIKSKLDISVFPDKLAKYIDAVSAYCDVDSDMCVLPALSILSLCLQGKAVVKHPANSHIEPLNLYTLTVVSPGQRKSEVLKCFRFPIDDFQKDFNIKNSAQINKYLDEKEFYENALRREKNSPKGDLNRIQALRQQLDSLKPFNKKKLYLTDATPEAIARELYLHGERMGLFSDESTFLEIMGGIYSKSGTNFNILLTSYDGSPFFMSRQTSEEIALYNPLLTVCSMVQNDPFFKALNNKKFTGKGLLQRFIFSFPKGKTGDRKFYTPNIPEYLTLAYKDMINSLLCMKTPENMPVLQFDGEATKYLQNYHDMIQTKEKADNPFEGKEDYAEKQFGKVMRIAALLHLIEHEPTEKINANTAFKAQRIGLWSEEQAFKAFGIIEDTPEVEVQKYIIQRLKKVEKPVITQSDLVKLCQRYKAPELTHALEELDDRCMIKYYQDKNSDKVKKPKYIKINPEIKNLKV